MNRKYPIKMFIFGVILNFLIRNFFLFVPGVVLCLVGIAVRNCLYIGLAMLIFDLILSVYYQFQIRKEVLSESDNPEFNELMDAFCDPDNPNAFKEKIDEKIRAAAEEPDDHQEILQKLVVYRTLKEAIRDGMTLEEMIDAFARMCEIPVGDPDDLLFETGSYNFTGEKMFHFCLVRQFQFLDEDEYVQLHLRVLYAPSARTALLYRVKWASLTKGDFFDMVKSSRAFKTVKEMPIAGVEIRVEET